MKVNIERFSNPNFLIINVDKRMSAVLEEKYVNGKKIVEQPRIVYGLLDIDGIERVTLRRYSINLSKGSFFEWNLIVPRILEAIKPYLSPKEEIEIVNIESDIGSDSGIDLNS